MSSWNELKRPFRNALIAAFTVDRPEPMLRYRCEQELEQITGKNQARPKIVDDVIIHAAQFGWLENLAEGALAANPRHTLAVRLWPTARPTPGCQARSGKAGAPQPAVLHV